MRLILSVLCLLAISFGAFGQAPGIQRQPLTTNQHFGPLPSEGHVPIWNATLGKWTNNVVGGEWIYESGLYDSWHARLERGSTNSLRVMTNGLQGIIIGDTNAAALDAYWPYDGLTFTSWLDGSTGHDLNEMMFGVLNSSGYGGWIDSVVASGLTPRVNVIGKVNTNAVLASMVETRLDADGGYFTLVDNGGANQVTLRAGNINYSGGDFMIRAYWNFIDRFSVFTNGIFTINSIAYTPPTVQGTSGMALIGDGSGNLAWTNRLPSVTIFGTTNQLVFGATNIAPVSTVVPTHWISVQVSGNATVFRLPLYQ